MAELDLIWMSLVIFIPTRVRAGADVLSARTEEYMRWWSLLGTAVTLVVSLFVFIDFNQMLEHTATAPAGAPAKPHFWPATTRPSR